MKNKKVSFKHLGIGILCIISYFLFTNLIMLLLVKTGLFTINNVPVLYLASYAITLSIYIVIFNKELKSNFKDFKKNYKKYLPNAFLRWVQGFFVMASSNIILSFILKNAQSVNQAENLNLLKSNILMHSLTVVLIAPFLEELVFRLSFKKMTNDKKIFALITGILFGFIHIISSLSLKNPLNILMLIPYSAMGVALGYIYKESKNIFTSLTIHVFHNLLTVLAMIVSIKGGII